MARFQPVAPSTKHVEDTTRTFEKEIDGRTFKCAYNADPRRYDVKEGEHLIYSAISFAMCEQWVDKRTWM